MLAAASTQGQSLDFEREDLRLRQRPYGLQETAARRLPVSAAGVLAWAAALAPAMVAAVLYLPSLGFGFVFDDHALIGTDGIPLPLGGILPYRPLRYASYLVDAWMGGSPAVYHAHNVLLHALACSLVVVLARRLGCGRMAALLGGLVVACHPIAVEAAAYVSGRRDLLCVAFGLGSVTAHLSGRRGAAMALLLASVSAKESGLVFAGPLLAATLAGLDGRTSSHAKQTAHAMRTEMAIVFAAAAGLAWAVAYGAIGPWLPAANIESLTLPGRIASHYALGLAGLRALAPEYPELLLPAPGGGAMHVAATVVLLAAVPLALWRCVRANSRESGARGAFTLAWLVTSAAALSIWGGLHEPGADRHAYLLLPAIGIGLAFVLSQSGRARGGVFVWPLAAVVLAWSLAASRQQMLIWRDDASLWSHAATRADASPRVRANFARVLADAGDYGGAVRQMNMAVAATPLDARLFLGRAAVRCAQDRHWMARRDLRHAGELGASAASVAALARDCPIGPSGAGTGSSS